MVPLYTATVVPFCSALDTTYIPNRLNYGNKDYWALPSESFARGLPGQAPASPMVHFYAAQVAHFYAVVDKLKFN